MRLKFPWRNRGPEGKKTGREESWSGRPDLRAAGAPGRGTVTRVPSRRSETTTVGTGRGVGQGRGAGQQEHVGASIALARLTLPLTPPASGLGLIRGLSRSCRTNKKWLGGHAGEYTDWRRPRQYNGPSPEPWHPGPGLPSGEDTGKSLLPLRRWWEGAREGWDDSLLPSVPLMYESKLIRGPAAFSGLCPPPPCAATLAATTAMVTPKSRLGGREPPVQVTSGGVGPSPGSPCRSPDPPSASSSPSSCCPPSPSPGAAL